MNFQCGSSDLGGSDTQITSVTFDKPFTMVPFLSCDYSCDKNYLSVITTY